MPNPAQLELLHSFFGEEGIYSSTIENTDVLDTITKMVLLEKAITEDYQTFLTTIDKLNMTVNQKSPEEELIRALKAMNDVCFNNDVMYGEYGTRPALEHYFGSLGAIHANEFQEATRELIGNGINRIIGDDWSDGHEVEKQSRCQAINDSPHQNQQWRELFDLPQTNITAHILTNNLIPLTINAQDGHADILMVRRNAVTNIDPFLAAFARLISTDQARILGGHDTSDDESDHDDFQPRP